ncbi:DUF6056 family protein [Loigolactobacillus coryniformis subsp. coryniformis]|uniref:DUF3329 domain-containing protein n=1 Tax=Loigolactobacillus coryniformis TaxID=1610 RepID=UPI003992EF00
MISIVVFGLFFKLNQLTTYLSDDFAYRYIYNNELPSNHIIKISGFRSIIISQYHHYFLKNGRFVAQSIVQYFMQYNKLIFNVFNSLIFLALGFLIDYISRQITKTCRISSLMIVFIFTSLWFVLPEFGASTLWLSGSCNYLWVSMFYLGLLIFNMKYFTTNVYTVIIGAMLGFLAGATNENSGPGAVLIIILYLAMNWYLEKCKPRIYQLVSIITAGIGFVLMMESPGSKARGRMDINLATIISNIHSVYNMSTTQFLIWYLILFILVLICLQKQILSTRLKLQIVIFVVGHFATLYVLVLSPERPLRTMFGVAIFLIIPIVALGYMLVSKPFVILTFILLALCSFSYFNNVKRMSINYHEIKKQELIYTKSQGENCTVKLITPQWNTHNPYSAARGLSCQPNDWANQWQAAFYNVKSIKGR